MPQVEAVKTPITLPEWETVTERVLFDLRRSYEIAFPEKKGFAILWGQFSLETAAGASVWNWNFGNHMCLISKPYVEIKAYNGTLVHLCAYDDADAGAHAWLLWFTSKKDVWSTVMAGDATSFARVLREHGYYGKKDDPSYEPESVYAKGVQRGADRYMKEGSLPRPIGDGDSDWGGHEETYLDSHPVVMLGLGATIVAGIAWAISKLVR